MLMDAHGRPGAQGPRPRTLPGGRLGTCRASSAPLSCWPPRLVGWHKACEISLLGRILESADIERLGLANRIIPHDELLDEAMSWASELAGNPPLAMAATKRTMRQGLDSTFEANTSNVMAELMQLFQTDDFRESLVSFMEKRDPKYTGR